MAPEKTFKHDTLSGYPNDILVFTEVEYKWIVIHHQVVKPFIGN